MKRNLWNRKFPEEMMKQSAICQASNGKYPFMPNDTVCPPIVKLKWAHGCPYECSWCFLLGTLRGKVEPVVKDCELVVKGILKLFDNKELKDRVELCNTALTCDSIATGSKPLQVKMLCLFANQKDTNHKILFLSKSEEVDHFLPFADEARENAIFSFTINANEISQRWEVGVPSVKSKIQGARKLEEVGYEVRLRIDPIIPMGNWEYMYSELIDSIDFIPDMVTFGTIRKANPRIVELCKQAGRDTSWNKYRDDKRYSSKWGIGIPDRIGCIMVIR